MEFLKVDPDDLELEVDVSLTLAEILYLAEQVQLEVVLRGEIDLYNLVEKLMYAAMPYGIIVDREEEELDV